ncbi:hypothetical protein THAOC_18473, partial [Thalassiosira oceanica]
PLRGSRASIEQKGRATAYARARATDLFITNENKSGSPSYRPSAKKFMSELRPDFEHGVYPPSRVSIGQKERATAYARARATDLFITNENKSGSPSYRPSAKKFMSELRPDFEHGVYPPSRVSIGQKERAT